MEIRVRDTGAVMYEQGFKDLYTGLGLPSVLTEEVLNAWGADLVYEGPQATGGTVYQFSMRHGVVKIGNKWHTKYILGPLFNDTPEDGDRPAKKAAEYEAEYKAMKDTEKAVVVRQQRNDLLKASDWTQLSDSTINKTTWATYRQSLRDVPSQSGFPWTITWPTKPE